MMKKTIKLLFIILISLSLNIKDIKAEDLPKVYFEGNMSKMTKKSDEREIKIKYVSEELNFEAYAKIKPQGTSSLAYEKKNYTIKLYKDKEYENKLKIDTGLGWGKQYKFCLKANWIDKTHARNIVTARIASNIQDKYNLFENTPNNGVIDGYPVEIYLNDEFLGLYTWNIPKDAWMFNMDEDNENHIVLGSEGYEDANFFKGKATFDNWSVEAGPETDETLVKLNKLIDFIKDSSDEEFKENIDNHLNLDSTLNYYIMLNFAELVDNTAKNMLIVTYDGKIWYPSLYDLDTSWGTQFNGQTTLDYERDMILNYQSSLLFTKLEKNFPNEIANRYFELRKDILTKENVMKEFNNFYNSIPKETLKKEQERWENIPGYDLDQIKEFLNVRTPLVDEKMYNLYTIEPEINIEYSTKKLTLKPVIVKILSNRNDIKIIQNGKTINNNELKFIKNGTYEYEYQDWYGNNLGTIKIEINNILTYKLINSIIIILTGITLFKTFKNKKDNTEKVSKETTTKKEVKKNNTINKKDSKNSSNKKEDNKKNPNKKKSTTNKNTTITKSSKNSVKKNNSTKNSNTKKSPTNNKKDATKKKNTTNKKVNNNSNKTNNKTKKKDINPKN